MYWPQHLCRICASVGSITYPIFDTKNADIEANIKRCFSIHLYKDDFKPKQICSTCLAKLNEYCMFIDLYLTSNDKFESILYQNNRTNHTTEQDYWQNRLELVTELFSPTENSVITKSDELMNHYKNEIIDLNTTNNTQNIINQSNNALNLISNTNNSVNVDRHASTIPSNISTITKNELTNLSSHNAHSNLINVNTALGDNLNNENIVISCHNILHSNSTAINSNASCTNVATINGRKFTIIQASNPNNISSISTNIVTIDDNEATININDISAISNHDLREISAIHNTIVAINSNNCNNLNTISSDVSTNNLNSSNAITNNGGDISSLNMSTANRDTINESLLVDNLQEIRDVLGFETNQTQTVLRHSSDLYKNKNYPIECNMNSYEMGNRLGFNYDKNVALTEDNEQIYNNDFNADKIRYMAIPATSIKLSCNFNANETKIGGDKNINNKKDSTPIVPVVLSTKVAKKFVCTHCDKSFIRKLSLKTHMSNHTKIKPFACEFCSKCFTLRCELNCHLKLHANTFQCEYCLKSFAVASKLERHRRIHTNNRQFKCDKCDKGFNDKRNLVGHQITHTNAREFFCDVCKKYYKSKSQLKDHQKGHSDVSFTCDICNKKFKWKTNLLAHIKTHTDFVCKKCKIDFKSSTKLMFHKESCSL